MPNFLHIDLHDVYRRSTNRVHCAVELVEGWVMGGECSRVHRILRNLIQSDDAISLVLLIPGKQELTLRNVFGCIDINP